MSKKSVLCITTSIPQAGLIVDRLKNEAFSNNDISVPTDNSDEVVRAKEIFEEAGAEDISTAGESSTKGRATSLAER